MSEAIAGLLGFGLGCIAGYLFCNYSKKENKEEEEFTESYY